MAVIYLDNSAGTRPFGEVIKLVGRIQAECYGNPSSRHQKGLEAEEIISSSRRDLASLLGTEENEIIFTSGGTEANNLAVKGAAYRNCRRGRHIITSSIEHPSVLNCFRSLAEEGFTVSYLPVDESGTVDPAEAAAAVKEDTILVSIMHVNNETGTIQPLNNIGPAIKKRNPDLLFHIDAVQSFTRLPLQLKAWQADLISCSSHKMHGPRGAGCLWIKPGVKVKPLLDGGGQEMGLRSGTENVAAIAGFALAAKLSARDGEEKMKTLAALKHGFYEAVENSGISFHLNGPPPAKAAPHILNLSFYGLKAETMLHALEEKGIYVSAGSACHSRRPEPSHVLTAMGLKDREVESALRFSFSIDNDQKDIAHAAAITISTANKLLTL